MSNSIHITISSNNYSNFKLLSYYRIKKNKHMNYNFSTKAFKSQESGMIGAQT